MKKLIALLSLPLWILAWSAQALEPHQVNINTANADELAEMLDGIGTARAEAIVEHRETNGQFKALVDVEAVQGIGAYLVEANKERIVFED